MAVVTYEAQDGFAQIALDDGKANVLSPATLAELDAALDQAEADRLAVLLVGRPGVFSGGFDLHVLRAGDEGSAAMLHAGFTLAERLLGFPRPVVAGCTGHAVAMGLFVLLSCDYRVGAAGPFRLVANEVALGLTMPRAAAEICRQRLTPAALHRTVVLAEPVPPEDAVVAGVLDAVVAPEEVVPVGRAVAQRLAALDHRAHTETKLRVRLETLTRLRRAIEDDDLDLASLLGAR